MQAQQHGQAVLANQQAILVAAQQHAQAHFAAQEAQLLQAQQHAQAVLANQQAVLVQAQVAQQQAIAAHNALLAQQAVQTKPPRGRFSSSSCAFWTASAPSPKAISRRPLPRLRPNARR